MAAQTHRDAFREPVSRHVWESRYRWRDAGRVRDRDVAATRARIASALAAAEAPEARTRWQQGFRAALEDFRFLPGGRIIAGAGTGRRVTLLNCFVMGLIEDSMEGIFRALHEGALTMQQGGGIGYDFSTLRPRGTPARSTGATASGPVSFMHVWDAMCATVLSTGARRGAMMATLRCDHPDILEFVDAKRERGALTRFNISVQVTDAFVEAVRADADWPLVFPEQALGGSRGTCLDRRWPGEPGPVRCRVLASMPAHELWDRIMRAAYQQAEPGVLFIDRINEWNNLGYRENLSATNPCGEIPLPPYGACDLGSVNLARLVRGPFTPSASIDFRALRALVPLAVRMLDNVIDISRYPLPQQADTERGCRRIGLGLTGLADALIMLGLRYDRAAARRLAARVMRAICYEAYRASTALAAEKGAFPQLDLDAYLQRPFIRALPQRLQAAIARHGIRNSHLTAIAPTGTISLFADNVSSALEPVFDFRFRRAVRQRDGRLRSFGVRDDAYVHWLGCGGDPDGPLPAPFLTAHEVAPRDHLAMQAALQPFVDSAISKTINVPASFPFGDFRDLYLRAWELGLKGCTSFRPNEVTGAVMEIGRGTEAVHCCSLEREAD